MEGVDYTLEGDFQIVFDSALIDTSTSTSCVRINLTDDSVLEESEFFSVVVTSVTPSIVNGDVSGSIEIQADDSHSKYTASLETRCLFSSNCGLCQCTKLNVVCMHHITMMVCV